MNSVSSSQISAFETWLQQRYVEVDGKNVPIEPYRFKTNPFTKEVTGRSEFYIIGNSTFFIHSKGNPTNDQLKAIADDILQHLKDSKRKKFEVIWNLGNDFRLSLKSRKYLEKSAKLLLPYLNKQYIVAKGSLLDLVKLFIVTNPKEAADMVLCDSVEQAVQLIFSKNPEKYNIKSVSKPSRNQIKTDLQKMTKEQLINKILDDQDDNQAKINELVIAIDSINWDPKFRPHSFDINQNDPYYYLFTSINILQEEIQEVVGDLVDLNKNLELKVAERIVDLMDKESNLRVLIENNNSITCLINNRYEIMDFNQLFVDEFNQNYQSKVEIGTNILDLISDKDDQRDWKKRIDKALSGNVGIYVDSVLKGEEELVWEIRFIPIKEVGNIKGVSIFIKDITEIKQSELKLIEKNKDLQKVNGELDSFVYRVSHDLRAPLTSILGLISLIKKEDDPVLTKHYIDLQQKSVQKLDNFIKDIISISRNSRLDLNIDSIHFEEIIGQVYEELQYTMTESIIDRRFSIHSNTKFYSDPHRLKIIFNNLISNAIKYINPFENEPIIDINIHSDHNKALINIKDNGMGIDESHIDKVFRMFYRADQSKSGSGLGLYIVKETIDRLGGSIKLLSEPNIGTEFRIEIPNLSFKS